MRRQSSSAGNNGGPGRKVIHLHIGFQKTGSTAIQAGLLQSADRFGQDGIIVPFFEIGPGMVQVTKTNFGPAFVSAFGEPRAGTPVSAQWGSEPQDFEEARSHMLAAVETAIGAGERIVISGEGIATLPTTGLMRLRSWFDSRGWSLDVVAVVRPPLDFVTSMTQLRINTHRGDVGEPVFVSQSARILMLMAVFGDEISFVPFAELTAHERGPFGWFLEWLKVSDPADFDLPTVVNPSISNEAARILQFINGHEPRLLGRVLFPEARADRPIEGDRLNPRRSASDAGPLSLLPGRKFFLSLEERLRMNDQLIAENALMADVLGEGFANDSVEPISLVSEADEEFTEYGDEHFDYLRLALTCLDSRLFDLTAEYFENSPMVSADARERAAGLFSEVAPWRAVCLTGPVTVDRTRTLALEVEADDLPLAYLLMSAAYCSRPFGIYIERRRRLFERKLFGQPLKLPRGVHEFGSASLDRMETLAQRSAVDDGDFNVAAFLMAHVCAARPTDANQRRLADYTAPLHLPPDLGSDAAGEVRSVDVTSGIRDRLRNAEELNNPQ